LGFQDTVVAIEALAKYARLTYVENLDLRVRFPNLLPSNDNITINSESRLVVRSQNIETFNEDVEVEISGTGCLLIQVEYSPCTKYTK